MRHQRELWRQVQRAVAGETLGRPRLWTDVELDALKARVVRDSRARGVYVRAIVAGCQARGIEPPALDVLDPPRDIETRVHVRWYLLSRLMAYERMQSEVLPVENVEDAWRDHEEWMEAERAAGRQYRPPPQASFVQAYPDEFASLKAHVGAAPRYRQWRQQELADATDQS
jgi:hypothetical protein